MKGPKYESQVTVEIRGTTSQFGHEGYGDLPGKFVIKICPTCYLLDQNQHRVEVSFFLDEQLPDGSVGYALGPGMAESKDKIEQACRILGLVE